MVLNELVVLQKQVASITKPERDGPIMPEGAALPPIDLKMFPDDIEYYIASIRSVLETPKLKEYDVPNTPPKTPTKTPEPLAKKYPCTRKR